jgi:hypothetical protein
MFKRLARKWAIPGWIVLAFWIIIEGLDWWHRIEFVRAKVIKLNPSFQPVFEWVISGQGRLCIMLLGFVLLFLAVLRKERYDSVSHQAPAAGPQIAPPASSPTAQEPKPPVMSLGDPSQKKDLVSERIIVDVTPLYLMDLFSEHTSIQAQRLIEPYIGKWIRISGPLGDVSDNEYFSQVVFEHGPKMFAQVFMYFRQPNRSDRLSVLRRGTELTVLGQIERVNGMEVHLDNCELI